MSIYGNAVGGSSGFGKTFILEDEAGTQFMAVCVGEETVFTATDNDVREGLVYASDKGVSIGSKKAYRTLAESYMIYPRETFSIPLSVYDLYDYTTFQCMISKVNIEDLENSVETNKIAFNDGVYMVNSTNKMADVTKNTEAKSIDLNITNDSDDYFYIHYFTYREEV